MHRAEQIINAIVTRIQDSLTIGIAPENVFPNRTLSLSEKSDEIPAVTVNGGDDNTAPEYTEMSGEIGSEFEIFTTIYAIETTEALLKSLLYTKRAEIQKAIRPPDNLGLPFVLKVEYGGAAAIENDITGEMHAGKYELRWLVTYHADETDPN